MLDQTDIAMLKNMAQSIRALFSNSSEKCSIVIESHADEAILVGTNIAFARLAAECIECAVAHASNDASTDFEVVDIHGTTVLSTDIVSRVFSDTGMVRPVCALVARTQQDCDLVQVQISPES